MEPVFSTFVVALRLVSVGFVSSPTEPEFLKVPVTSPSARPVIVPLLVKPELAVSFAPSPVKLNLPALRDNSPVVEPLVPVVKVLRPVILALAWLSNFPSTVTVAAEPSTKEISAAVEPSPFVRLPFTETEPRFSNLPVLVKAPLSSEVSVEPAPVKVTVPAFKLSSLPVTLREVTLAMEPDVVAPSPFVFVNVAAVTEPPVR